MGYSKKKAVAGIIPIPMGFKVLDPEMKILSDVIVVHYVQFPNKEIREKYEQESIKIKGRKVRPAVSSASWNMWLRIIDHVDGYDDLPESDNSDKQKLREYFSGDIETIHVNECILRLNDMIGAEDAEVEKKSELSYEGSSGEVITKTPISETA
jgi:hypothetical protein